MISLEDSNLSDAELAISEANRLRPNNADILSLLGDVYCEKISKSLQFSIIKKHLNCLIILFIF